MSYLDPELAAFLTARLDEAEADHIAYNDPAAALRSVKADRWLLAELAHCQGDDVAWDEALALAARCRAMTGSTHPDYLERWLDK